MVKTYLPILSSTFQKTTMSLLKRVKMFPELSWLGLVAEAVWADLIVKDVYVSTYHIIYCKPFDKFILPILLTKEKKEKWCGEGVDGWEPGDKKK